MSSAISTISIAAHPPAKVEPKPQPGAQFHLTAPNVETKSSSLAADARQPEHHHSAVPSGSSTALSPTALSSTDISYVQSLMGVIPAQKMEDILLKTGVPVPVNLGPTFDTTV